MIKITTNFDKERFKRDLERRVREAAEQKVRSRLRDLAGRGLRVSFGQGGASSLNLRLDGPDELVAEAKRRFS
jgi:hypothetical protein